MPDITMCITKECYLSKTCFRHTDSGTIPDKYRQSVFVDKHFVGDDCDHYWRVTHVEVGEDNED